MSLSRNAVVRGFLGAGLLVVAGSLALLPLVNATDLTPTPGLLRSLAQIGATLLVAYAVEVSWLLKVSADRGESLASWIGYMTGIGASGLLGLALALLLSEHGGDSLSLVAQYAVGWVLVSLFLLGLLVALLPLLVYESAHAAGTESPDE